ncbi:uncharacterized protein LOC112086437 [Eutrema salsugineum]|uniref:uncharacterized protein LOC112086437 n=1 Tax=Eutrema salsugineum TaxID=72664 RepID=UPI000CECECEA|nr:uncharacterized protein LOC112086437 [Eutrema salsugineum]
MASLWLKLISLGLICVNCIAKPTMNLETEFECVSMYEQSALQHPLMKNHLIQTRPSRELLSMLSSSNDDTITKIVLKGSEECPKGQVPIHKPKTNLTNNIVHPQQFTKAGRLLKQARGIEKRRYNKLRTKKLNYKYTYSATFSQRNKKPHNQPKIFREYNQHYAILRTFENTTKKWRGAQALFTINKPRVAQDQYSKAWIWLNYIQMNVMTSIQFGVAVHTKLYQDDRPRLTTYWMSEKQQDGCYNALCPGGYVQIHKSIYPGMIYDKVSIPGGQQHTVHLSVAEDPVTKNWVLTIGTIMIGYWPRQTYMADGASEVYFGGFAGTSLPYTLSPPMGTGDFPTKDLTRSCYMKQLRYVLSDYTLVDINSNEVEYYIDDPKCYGVMFLKYVDFDSRETLTFGGPGGHCRPS